MKRKVFNATLKQLTDCLEQMCSGSRFHSEGAATANERAPNFVAVLGMTRSSRAADRSLRLASTEDTGWHMSARHCLLVFHCILLLSRTTLITSVVV